MLLEIKPRCYPEVILQQPLILQMRSCFHRGTWPHLHARPRVWQRWQPAGAGQGLLWHLYEALSAAPESEALHLGFGVQGTDLSPGPSGCAWHEGRWSPLWRRPSLLSHPVTATLTGLYQCEESVCIFSLSKMSQNGTLKWIWIVFLACKYKISGLKPPLEVKRCEY